jgi:hypothetical protein
MRNLTPQLTTNDMKTIKTYKVTFAEETKKGEEYLNVDSKVVLAESVSEAIVVARDLLPKKDQKTCFAQEVELISVID